MSLFPKKVEYPFKVAAVIANENSFIIPSSVTIGLLHKDLPPFLNETPTFLDPIRC